MSRTQLLVTILLAFRGIRGNLTEAQCDEGMAIIENEYDGDLKAAQVEVDAALAVEMDKIARLAAQEKG